MIVVMALSVAVLFSSCGKVPQAEIDAAFAALDSAKMAGADVYLAEDFTALQDSMKAITENVEAQKSKFFANYGDIKEKLAQVTEQAAATVGKTEARKEEVKQEVAALQAEVATLQTQNNELVAKAPKGKEGKAALEAIKADIALIDTTVGEANTQIAAGELMPALDKMKAAKEKAVAINTELNDVIAKYTGKK